MKNDASANPFLPSLAASVLEPSAVLLQRLGGNSAAIDLSLRDGYFRLLEKMGNPHLFLPPTLHVAGTNGKGSTIAFMRAMLEAAGKKVHVYTSPHLVRFHERIRLAGTCIDEVCLTSLLEECLAARSYDDTTFFESTTAIAFAAFARHKADVLLLETGLGGRLDATNVVPSPLASVITRISHDHHEFLGPTLTDIAREKAGIFRKGTPVILGSQDHDEVTETLLDHAVALTCRTYLHQREWNYTPLPDGHFTVSLNNVSVNAPLPSLVGAHQYANAATAIVALQASGLFKEDMLPGLARAEWPARLQRLTHGPLLALLPENSECWLDGGHNDSAGLVLAQQAAAWHKKDGRPLFLVCGMLKSKDPRAFLAPLAPYARGIALIAIPGEAKSMDAPELTRQIAPLAMAHAASCQSPEEAMTFLASLCQDKGHKNPRFLITGSLYLAGHILGQHS